MKGTLHTTRVKILTIPDDFDGFFKADA